MSKRINLHSDFLKLSIIHEEENFMIAVRRYRKQDGEFSKKSLVKIELNSNAGSRYGKHRGFQIGDLLILKKNWGKILKELAS